MSIIYRNVNRFTDAVSETAHNGHPVSRVRPLTADECDIAEVGQMWQVRCDADGAVFDAFPEELTETA